MLTDPAVISVNGSNKSLTRINQDRYSSEYMFRSATEEFRMRVRNSSRPLKAKGGIRVDRHNVELTHTVFPVAPATRSFTRFAYVVFENEEGDTLLDPSYIVTALAGFLTAANVAKLQNFES
jgi:hypothetical protein